jgi:hypothetical protein
LDGRKKKIPEFGLLGVERGVRGDVGGDAGDAVGGSVDTIVAERTKGGLVP